MPPPIADGNPAATTCRWCAALRYAVKVRMDVLVCPKCDMVKAWPRRKAEA